MIAALKYAKRYCKEYGKNLFFGSPGDRLGSDRLQSGDPD